MRSVGKKNCFGHSVLASFAKKEAPCGIGDGVDVGICLEVAGVKSNDVSFIAVCGELYGMAEPDFNLEIKLRS